MPRWYHSTHKDDVSACHYAHWGSPQWFVFDGYISQVTPQITYFHHLKLNLQDGSTTHYTSSWKKMTRSPAPKRAYMNCLEMHAHSLMVSAGHMGLCWTFNLVSPDPGSCTYLTMCVELLAVIHANNIPNHVGHISYVAGSSRFDNNGNHLSAYKLGHTLATCSVILCISATLLMYCWIVTG